jgi:hypothetical protein
MRNDYWFWDSFFNKEQIKNFNLKIQENLPEKENSKKAAFGYRS